jgi:hypothetical protein
MGRVVYTSHAKLRLKVRGIDESEVYKILKSPQKLYFDVVTGALIAVGPRTLVKDHWLIVVYAMEGDVVKVMTVVDVHPSTTLLRGA